MREGSPRRTPSVSTIGGVRRDGSGRGWDADTIDEKLLGYTPANYRDELVTHLFDRGHGRAEILAMGLFGERDRFDR